MGNSAPDSYEYYVVCYGMVRAGGSGLSYNHSLRGDIQQLSLETKVAISLAVADAKRGIEPRTSLEVTEEVKRLVGGE